MSQTDSTDETSLAGLDDDSFNIHDYALEDFLTLGIFWLLALDVFMQFFSRYVLGNSIGYGGLYGQHHGRAKGIAYRSGIFLSLHAGVAGARDVDAGRPDQYCLLRQHGLDHLQTG